MGIFDNFKQQGQPYYDTTNLRVTDLDLNFVFDYDLSTWQVKEVYEYDWGNNFFTREYKITDGKSTLFLYVEEDDEVEISVSHKISVVTLGEHIPNHILQYKKPPQQIHFQDKTYYLEEESLGYFSNVYSNQEGWSEFISWDYVDKSGEFILCVEQWEEHKFEASFGKNIKAFEISNINPGDSNAQKKTNNQPKKTTDKRTTFIGIIAVIFFFISFRGCFNEGKQTRPSLGSSTTYSSFSKNPVDEIIKNMSDEQNFSIILYDMDYAEAERQYTHKYNVLVEREDTVLEKSTEWLPVSAAFFQKHVDDMGMEIASKKDGKLSKATVPAGYSNYIGNEKYGQWRTSNGTRFWEFYGRYAFLSSMFRMATFPVRYSMWNDYYSNYHRSGRNYYGSYSNGGSAYGTSSNYTQSNTDSKWNNRTSGFKSSVRNRVQPSSARTTQSRTNNNYTRTTRSSSRYGSTSYRSRGGSFGK